MSLFAFLACLRQKLTGLCLQNRFACETYAQLLEYLPIYLTEHHGAMYLTATQLWELLESTAAILVFL